MSTDSAAGRVQRVHVIDSHTGGEPTRVVIGGGPNLGAGPLAERVEQFRRYHDRFRSAVVDEPRGSGVLVGALLCEPFAPDCTTGVIFFNNTGTLGMCGHGIIGLAVTLAHTGQLSPGRHRIDTPVGVVTAELHADGSVSVANVPSWRAAADVTFEVEGHGPVSGDVAWGGNWFFLATSVREELTMARVDHLTAFARSIRAAVNGHGFPQVNHVELFGPPQAGGDSRNFVLCPGDAYDRSPCGTGTSAKLACLAAAGALGEGAEWTQESLVGSSFRGTFTWIDREKGIIAPVISGRAWVNAEATLLLSPDDPFCWGFPVPPA